MSDQVRELEQWVAQTMRLLDPEVECTVRGSEDGSAIVIVVEPVGRPGRLIGKDGWLINAVRQLASAVGGRLDRSVRIDLKTDTTRRDRGPRPMEFDGRRRP